MSAIPHATNPYEAPASVGIAGGNYTGAAEGVRLATRGERLLGSILDAVIMVPVAMVMGALLGVGLVMAGMDPETTVFQVIAKVGGTLVGIGVFLAVNGYTLANRGQTIGKIVMKTRIVAENGRPVPFGPLVLKRYLPVWVLSALPFVGGFFAIANALMIFRGNVKCLHDDFAGTKVIKV